MAKKKPKKNPLAAAAKRKLESIGGPKLSPADVAHMMWHAEQRGEVERTPLEDGSWAWLIQTKDGPQMLKPTPEMLSVLEHFERGGHEEH